MDGKRIAVIAVLGILGTAFVGYCIYFDRKRRSHPDYKKNVLKSKRVAFSNCHVFTAMSLGRKSTMRQNSKVRMPPPRNTIALSPSLECRGFERPESPRELLGLGV